MLIGNLTRDPELRYTPSGVAVCNFGMATNRQWTDTEGTLQESAEFHRIVAWGKLAELCSQLLFKGRKVYVEGRIQTREWTAQDGTKRITTEIVIDSMLVLDRRTREELAEEVVAEPVAVPTPAPTSGVPQTDQGKKKKKREEPEAVEEVKEEKKEPSSAKAPEDKEEEVKKEDIPF